MAPRGVDRDAPPTVRSANPKAAGASPRLIPIPAAPKGAAPPRQPEVSPEQYWLEWYRTHDDHSENRKDHTVRQSAAEGLREKVALLNVNKKFRDVRAVLVGFLTHHRDEAEPWMYAALALAVRMNKGNEAEVKRYIGYATDMALRSRNPNHLVSIADQALLLGFTDRVGAMLDLAADLVPHRGEPLVMSINLARKTKDPERMGDSVEKLLSLGWPGMDETIRRDARKQVDTLAKTLRQEGRGEEADDLLARMPEAEARDLFIRLSWVGEADLDLAVEEPLGVTARVAAPRTVFGGAIVKNGLGTEPEEVYVCPRGFDGAYTVRVETIANDPKKPALQATLEVITHEGTPQEHKETHTVVIPPNGKPSEPVKVTLTGGRRKRALPFVAPPTPAPAAPSVAGSAGTRSGSKAASATAPSAKAPAARAGAAPRR